MGGEDSLYALGVGRRKKKGENKRLALFGRGTLSL